MYSKDMELSIIDTTCPDCGGSQFTYNKSIDMWFCRDCFEYYCDTWPIEW